MSSSLDPDQARQIVGPNLGPKCLQRLSPDDKGYKELKHKDKELKHQTLQLCEITDVIALNEPSHLDRQRLPSSLSIFNIIQFELKVFQKFADII